MRDAESQKNYSELKLKLEKTIQKVHSTSDLRESKGYLIEVQNCFKGLKLMREDREELYGKLQDAFSEINQKIKEQQENFENEAALNYFNLKTKVEDALFLADNSKDLNETWNFLIEIQSQFKGIKMKPEQRENLYSMLQKAFSKVKEKKQIEFVSTQRETSQNYEQLKTKVNEAVAFASQSDDREASRNLLSEVRSELREALLTREQKDELFEQLNNIMYAVKEQIEVEKLSKQITSMSLFEGLKQNIEEGLHQAEHSDDFRNVREQLMAIQQEVRGAELIREHRIELQEMLQQAFDILSSRQNTDRTEYLKSATENKVHLRLLIDKALFQAKESDKFKETREFLKSIQSEFKGIRLIKEDREELYAQLQSAFQILNTRIDEYFRTKKKNWEVRMQFKVSEMFTEIELMKESLQKNHEELSALETQLEIVSASGKDQSVMKGLQVRIGSVQHAIERKQTEIVRLEEEMKELKSRVEGEEE